MTDNEIIKALECCISGNCNDCPHSTIEDCFKTSLEKLTLDLINRLNANNKRLERRIKILEKELEISLSENMLPEYKYLYYFENGLVITKSKNLKKLIGEIEVYLK